MSESRQELLQWLNQLLQLSINKVEQCGTGAAYCQIMDSIYLDVPMSRVKFNVNTEYQYIQNYKILQNTFTTHNIDRPLRVESLIKCRMQDNLEFLQWIKRHWDQYYPGHEYDPMSRRKASGAPPSAGPSAASGRTSASARRTAPTTPATRAPRAVGSAGGAATGGQLALLREENAAMKQTVEGLEKERDFYFSKLRDIELLLQTAVEENPELEKEENGLIRHVQAILYSTEDGFEIPEEAQAAAEGNGDDLETF